jgi:hypothetical protein
MGLGKRTRVMAIYMLPVIRVSFMVRECLGIVQQGLVQVMSALWRVVVLEGMLVVVPVGVLVVMAVVSFFLAFIAP